MARIPTFISEPDRGVMPNSGSPALATPAAFGSEVADAQLRGASAIGAAQMELGQQVTRAGVVGGEFAGIWKKKEDASMTANGVANFDFTGTYLELQKKPPPDGMTYAQVVAQTYTEHVNGYVDKLPNDDVRNAVRDRLMAQKPQYVASAEQYGNRQAVALDKDAANSGLLTQENRVRVDGNIDTYDDAIVKSNAIIDSRPNLTPADKQIMKTANAEKLALRRFEGLISQNSDSPEALATLENELTVPDSVWKSRMSGDAFDRTLDKIQTLKKAANSTESAAARGALTSLRERNDKAELIDPVEMSATQDVVMKSKNPALVSQFAMIAKQQDIYRTHRDLPIEQQREKIEAMRNAKGVAGLPEPVRAGVNSGSTLTGGQISVEYLAGLVGIEYGQHLASGDYGKGTGHRIDGKPSSDAVGVAQFTSGTWASTVRRHAAALGIDPNATDAQIEAMRKDGSAAGAKRQVEAAALHALDNKQEMEVRMGRPVTDGDLYFAHFLGTGGAIRFLTAASQNPNAPATSSVDAAQVAANRPVFYDEAGRARSNAQVRSFIADASMNNMSRVDYAGVKAATTVLNNTVKGVRDDAISFAAGLGRFGDMGDISTPEGVARRGVVAGQIAEYYRVPTVDFKPFSKNEAEGLSQRIKNGTADEVLQTMTQIAALGSPDMVRAAHKQIGEKDALFGYAAALSYNMPDQSGVAADIIRGEKKMKDDKDALATIGMGESDLQGVFIGIVGKSLANTKVGTDTRKAAMAYYIERQLARGSAQPGRFDKPLFEESVQAVLGGGANPGKLAIDNVNGAKTLLPRGMSGPDVENSLSRMTSQDYAGTFSKWGGAPRYADGSVISPQEIAREGKFEAIGGGEYRIKMGDGKYALIGAYKDGSSDFYIFRGDPARMREVGARTALGRTLPPVVPGVTPAAPRVIGNE